MEKDKRNISPNWGSLTPEEKVDLVKPHSCGIKPIDLVKLIQYQWDNYGLEAKLLSEPISQPKSIHIDVEMETGDEIVKLMSQTRRHFK